MIEPPLALLAELTHCCPLRRPYCSNPAALTRPGQELDAASRILPCYAVESLPGFAFPSVHDTSLRAAWEESEVFNRFRGTGWMLPPCQGCERAELDWGGCRCQVFALTGDAATDPACALTPQHAVLA